ncbi:hypothetical protein E4U21_000250 [Claviceps maximensis]|nr:hypothetical protein E4U21_000250 [Claviceps maximensis]
MSNLRPLCVESVEIKYYEQLMLLKTMPILSMSPVLSVNRACVANIIQYEWSISVPQSIFQERIDLDKQSMTLRNLDWISVARNDGHYQSARTAFGKGKSNLVRALQLLMESDQSLILENWLQESEEMRQIKV